MTIQRPGPIAVILASAVCIFLLLPLIAVVPISFTSSRFLMMPSGALSLTHYRALIDNPEWASSILLSLRIGVVTQYFIQPFALVRRQRLTTRLPDERTNLVRQLAHGPNTITSTPWAAERQNLEYSSQAALWPLR